MKEWSAKIRIKQQLHNRGDHYEVELMALPRVNGIVIRYTTDASAPTGASAATYDGPIRIAANTRVVCAIGVAATFGLTSETVRIAIPKKGEDERKMDLLIPAKWKQQTKLDDSAAVWDFIERLKQFTNMRAHEIKVTTESTDGLQHIEYMGMSEYGYDSTQLKLVVDRLQEIVGGNCSRLTAGRLEFSTGQSLLDWLKATNQQFNADKVSQ